MEPEPGESSDDDAGAPFLEAEIPSGPPSDELARRLLDHEARQLQRVERLRERKRLLKSRLAAQKMKEKEFVAQMDAHMDDISKTEQELFLRAEQLAVDNQRLRAAVDQQSRDCAQQADRLAQSTKQCGESEARVQFLVDRIVALLSAAPGTDAEQTEAATKKEAVAAVRQRERGLLRKLEEARMQFDEVQRQNGELTSRLTEELTLSQRLSDQLAEVEERFFNPPEDRLPDDDLAAASSPSRLERLSPQPGLRSDHTEAPPDLLAGAPSAGGAATVAVNSVADWQAAAPDGPQPPAGAGGPVGEEEQDQPQEVHEDDPAQLELALLRPPSERGPLRAVLEEFAGEGLADAGAIGVEAAAGSPARARTSVEESRQEFLQDAQFAQAELAPHRAPNQCPLAAAPAREDAGAAGTAAGVEASETAVSQLPLFEAVVVMEAQLREALDAACFGCPVVRVEAGVYNFGPFVRAVVELAPNGQVVARRDGSGFEPIKEFIRNIPQALVEGVGAEGAGDTVEESGLTAPVPLQHQQLQQRPANAAGGDPAAADEAGAQPLAVPASWQALAAGGAGVVPAAWHMARGRQEQPRSLAALAAVAPPQVPTMVAASPRFLQAAPVGAVAMSRAPPLVAQARYIG